jgi:hypothetical protein
MLSNQSLNWYLALLCVATVGCKTPSNSSTKDIGVVNTANAKAKVLYSDGRQVFLKSCTPPLPAPLTRDCPSDEAAKSMALDDYMNKLPYDSSPYTRNDQGLAIVTKSMSDAQAAASGGNAQAQAAVTRLTPIKSNLEKLAQIRADLMPAQKDLTYYEWREEFSKLLQPFRAVGGQGSASDGLNKQCQGADEIIAHLQNKDNKPAEFCFHRLLNPSNSLGSGTAIPSNRQLKPGLDVAFLNEKKDFNEAQNVCQRLGPGWHAPASESETASPRARGPNNSLEGIGFYFVDVNTSKYNWLWSSSTDSLYTNAAWAKSLFYGDSARITKNDRNNVVCVRP